MTLLVLERVPASLRGFLTRWFIEVQPGVFVGHLSVQVREALWDEVVTQLRDRSSATMVTPSRNPQSLFFRVAGDPDREVVDVDGISLIRRRVRHGPS